MGKPNRERPNFGALLNMFVVFDYTESDTPKTTRIEGIERVREVMRQAEQDKSMRIAIYKLGEIVCDWS